ncbi:MAG: hypothetical protein JWR63_3077 [Conexibacter sp.]|nr:hypothetical protein [Conexibacter sp.]
MPDVSAEADEPSGLDLFAVGPDEPALNWTVSTPEEVHARAAAQPFEPAMVVLSQIDAALWHVRNDPAGQLQLARTLFGPGSSVTRDLETWVGQAKENFAFDERHFAILRALLVQEAASTAEFAPDSFVRALYATSALVEPASGAPEDPDGVVDWLGFLVRSGAYYGSRSTLHTIALAYGLWVDHAQRPEIRKHPDFCDIRQWLIDDHGFDAREQIAVGFAVIAAARLQDAKADFQSRSLFKTGFAQESALSDREDEIRALLSADRAWYRSRLAKLSEEALTWDRTPFEQRPLINLNGDVLLATSPQAMWSWLGQGLYFRALDAARKRNDLERLTRFYGELTERYIVELVDSAVPPDLGHVYRDELSGTKKNAVLTPDVAVDLGDDLVLMEVVSGRLTYNTLVTGDADALARDLVKLVDKKLAQLSKRSAEFLDGSLPIGDVDADAVLRLWPMIVVAEGIVAAEPLWAHIEIKHADAFGSHRIQPLGIIDTYELELLMALVEEGNALPDLLAQKADSAWRVMPFRHWIRDNFPNPSEVGRRPALVDRNWRAAQQLLFDVVFPGKSAEDLSR